jgi:dimethylamine/trimethylamine dehydrogenase
MPRRLGTETTKLECDSVILCTSRVSNTALYKSLKARKAEWGKAGIKGTYRIGDCHAPRLIHNAIFDGHRLAREFDSADPERPLPYIRERQVWGARIEPGFAGA